jgi:hypothetical protein
MIFPESGATKEFKKLCIPSFGYVKERKRSRTSLFGRVGTSTVDSPIRGLDP